ncbi:hypothetical protein [Rathayibacter sp. AY1B8]|uniref:hypothetical protein n=1 Tax=Rathayibacter sp. AY1B8 TaxID=2080533 RepID=UPI0015E33596|nr:hypothetical protein [Rathayibacter sp. AY1B8]
MIAVAAVAAVAGSARRHVVACVRIRRSAHLVPGVPVRGRTHVMTCPSRVDVACFDGAVSTLVLVIVQVVLRHHDSFRPLPA